MISNQEKIKEFCDIVNENPTLPVVFMVGYEVVGNDDHPYWSGELSKTLVSNLLTVPSLDIQIVGSIPDIRETLSNHLELINGYPSEETDIEPYMEEALLSRELHPAVVVYIDV